MTTDEEKMTISNEMIEELEKAIPYISQGVLIAYREKESDSNTMEVFCLPKLKNMSVGGMKAVINSLIVDLIVNEGTTPEDLVETCEGAINYADSMLRMYKDQKKQMN